MVMLFCSIGSRVCIECQLCLTGYNVSLFSYNLLYLNNCLTFGDFLLYMTTGKDNAMENTEI